MTATELTNKIVEYIINPLILLLFSLALLVFFWGLAQFILNMGSEEDRSTGKRHMLWGIIGMFIMFAVYGILGALAGTFGITFPPAP